MAQFGGRGKVVHGGLDIIHLPRVRLEDTDYGLIHSNFNLDRCPAHLADQANEILEYLNQKEPPGLSAYAKKQKAYNRLLMLWEIMGERDNKTGPHTVKKVAQEGNTEIYEVTLNIDFCERNQIQSSSVVVLEPYDSNQGYQEYYKGRVVRFDEETHSVRFSTFNRRPVPKANYILRLEPPSFVYNARDHIMNELLTTQKDYRFLVFPLPAEDLLTKEQYIELRDEAVEKMKLSSDRFNKEQREAIAAMFMAHQFKIRNTISNLVPYILHGPPGTGKTTTLVEACRLLEENNPDARILVCTPSNTAADLFAYELVHTAGIDDAAIFRLNALMHPITDLTDALKDLTLVLLNRDGVEQFGIPPFEQLMKYRIIVCTLLSSTYLTLGGMKTKFSHIFIDEAGQATELDTLVPIVGLLGPYTKVILAGDPRQLGPVETLEYFRKNGITSSLIERYETNENYKDDPRVMTMLRKNYRSHPAIIAVPSRLFYNNELYVPDDAEKRDSLAGWDALPQKGFPVVWHHVEAPDQKETDGHSYTNKGELEMVVEYIDKICAELHIKPSDIGVVSPYNYHTRKLRHRLADKGMDLTVDVVERYQGSQRRVIIVTTVRSNEKEHLGFLNSKKRFNTAITRAEELLIIVGNAKMMLKDPSWAEMLAYCRNKGATINMPSEAELFPELQAEDVEQGAGEEEKAEDHRRESESVTESETDESLTSADDAEEDEEGKKREGESSDEDEDSEDDGTEEASTEVDSKEEDESDEEEAETDVVAEADGDDSD